MGQGPPWDVEGEHRGQGLDPWGTEGWVSAVGSGVHLLRLRVEGFLLVLRPPWGSPPCASSPQYDELPHYPGVVDGPEALASFSQAAPPTPRASGPYGPHRPPQPPRPGLDSAGLKQEKDEIYG